MPRYAKRTDNNQADIVSQLRSIPGITVETDHDDILVGHKGITYWVELKNPNVVKKSGELQANALRNSQKRIKEKWSGQYLVAWSVKQILEEIGVRVKG